MAEKIRILILGDEMGLGEPLTQAIEKAGHTVDYCQRPDEAFNFLATRKYGFVFVDCMLQGSMNGVDFVLNVRKNQSTGKTKFILMSAIFTDRDFIKDAVDRTKAIAFLEKRSPFDFAQATKLIKADEEENGVPPARKILYQMFGKEKVSAREKRKIIESLEEVNGFDLPFVYSLLVETRSSGYLNIYEKNGSVSGISISQGKIVGVDVEDRTTYLGEMLIQSGYALPENVQTALTEKTNQKIGSRLIRANLLSPHAFDLILTEQMNIRLSRTVADQVIRINFAGTDVDLSLPCIDSDLLQFYLHDWIASKVTVSWLKSLFMSWSGNMILLSPNFKNDHPSLEMGLVKALPGLLARIQKGTTLNELLAEKSYPEAAVYKGLHFLLSRGLIVFGAKSAFRTDAEQLVALRRLWNDVQGKNPFEVVDLLGLENIEGENLLVLLGPQPKDATSPTATFWKNLKAKIEESVQKSSDRGSREKFKEDNANREAESKMQASRSLEEARTALGLGQYSKARDILAELHKNFPQLEHLHILLAWAKIGLHDPKAPSASLKDIEFELVQVPAEERYDAHYPLVLGLFHRVKGDLMGAKKNLERAMAMNSSLMAARRELAGIEAALKKEKDIFGSVDLKGMVAGLFKRR